MCMCLELRKSKHNYITVERIQACMHANHMVACPWICCMIINCLVCGNWCTTSHLRYSNFLRTNQWSLLLSEVWNLCPVMLDPWHSSKSWVDLLPEPSYRHPYGQHHLYAYQNLFIYVTTLIMTGLWSTSCERQINTSHDLEDLYISDKWQAVSTYRE